MKGAAHYRLVPAPHHHLDLQLAALRLSDPGLRCQAFTDRDRREKTNL